MLMRIGTVIGAFVLVAIVPGFAARAGADRKVRRVEVIRVSAIGAVILMGTAAFSGALDSRPPAVYGGVVPAQMVQKHSRAR